MRSFRISAGMRSRAAARIGMLGGALLVVLWIGISAVIAGRRRNRGPGACLGSVSCADADARRRSLLSLGSPRATSWPCRSAWQPPRMTLPDFCVPDAYEPDDSLEQANAPDNERDRPIPRIPHRERRGLVSYQWSNRRPAGTTRRPPTW